MILTLEEKLLDILLGVGGALVLDGTTFCSLCPQPGEFTVSWTANMPRRCTGAGHYDGLMACALGKASFSEKTVRGRLIRDLMVNMESLQANNVFDVVS